MKTVLLALLLAPVALRADLDSVRNEPDLEKRSEKALANAESALDRARGAYQKSDDKEFKGALDELNQSLDLCKGSLDESGKNARKRPKYFKKAEIGIRHLVRRLDNFKVEMSPDDRAPLEGLIDKAHKVQEEILQAIMGKKK
ncbi:MAG: hypothetical protein U0Q16_18700 [Bryobacteraceae bacterium]